MVLLMIYCTSSHGLAEVEHRRGDHVWKHGSGIIRGSMDRMGGVDLGGVTPDLIPILIHHVRGVDLVAIQPAGRM